MPICEAGSVEAFAFRSRLTIVLAKAQGTGLTELNEIHMGSLLIWACAGLRPRYRRELLRSIHAVNPRRSPLVIRRLPTTLRRAFIVNERVKPHARLAERHIALCAELDSHYSAPVRSNASRA
jgi:hypothetical protein